MASKSVMLEKRSTQFRARSGVQPSGRSGGPVTRLEADWQTRRAMYVEGPAWFPWLAARELEALQPLQQMRQSDPGLQARERRPETEVDAMSECNMRVGIPGDVKASGVGELPGVAVGGPDHGKHQLPGG